MTEKPNFFTVMTPDPARQQAMYEAYDNLEAARQRYDRLIAGRQGLQDDLQAKRAALDNAKADYQAGMGESADTGAVCDATKTAKANATTLHGEIASIEAMLADYQPQIQDAEQLLRRAGATFALARGKVIREMGGKRPEFGDAVTLGSMETIPLREAVLRYMARFEGAGSEAGVAFGAGNMNPVGFMNFLCAHFANPSAGEIADLRAEIEEIAWGPRAPGAPISIKTA